MASEKNLFRKAFGYLKHELAYSISTKIPKYTENIKNEMLYWLKYWSYEEKGFEEFPMATPEEYINDYKRELYNPPAYERTIAMTEVLENDFDRLIEEQVIKAKSLAGGDE